MAVATTATQRTISSCESGINLSFHFWCTEVTATGQQVFRFSIFFFFLFVACEMPWRYESETIREHCHL